MAAGANAQDPHARSEQAGRDQVIAALEGLRVLRIDHAKQSVIFRPEVISVEDWQQALRRAGARI